MADNLMPGEDTINAIYGDTPNYSVLPATTLNGEAAGPTDWNTVLTNGIVGATARAISNIANSAADSLNASNAPVVSINPNRTNDLLIMAAIAWLLLS